jgi:hypothetical protein
MFVLFSVGAIHRLFTGVWNYVGHGSVSKFVEVGGAGRNSFRMEAYPYYTSAFSVAPEHTYPPPAPQRPRQQQQPNNRGTIVTVTSHSSFYYYFLY